MSWAQLLGFGLALLVMLVGLVGCVVPALPGPPLILAAAVAHRLYFGAQGVGNWALAFLVGLTLFSLLLDYLATLYGAKKMGATWRGMLGAALGVIVGLFFGLPGVIMGPFLGATALELTAGRQLRESAQAGLGAMLGLVGGAFGKLICGAIMFGLFAVNVLSRSHP
jgi:uncharacterized protein YqgC (DUF456 family)